MLKNLIVNIFTRLFSSLSILILIPIYIEIIGEKGYGVIALYTMVLGLVTFTSSSFSSVILREMSISSIEKNKGNDRSVVISLERILFSVLIISLLIAFVIKDIALNGPFKEVVNAESIYFIIVIASLIFLTFNFYINGIFGKDKQVISNLLLLLALLLKALVGISVLYFINGDLRYFFFSQAIVDFTLTIFARQKLLNSYCNSDIKGSFDSNILMRNLKFAAGLTTISIIAAINLQADKALVSGTLGLELFSAYAAAASLAVVPIMLASIVGRSFYPKLVQSAVELDLNKCFSMTLFSSRLYLISCVFVIACFKLLEMELLGVWLGDNVIKFNVAIFFPLLFISSLLIGIQVFIYNIALAFKNTKINVALGIINATVILLLMPQLITQNGAIFMIYAYIILNLVTSIFYIAFVFFKFKIPGLKKITTEFLLILILTAFVIFIEHFDIKLDSLSLIIRMFCCLIFGCFFLFFIYKQRFVIRSFS